MVKTRNNNDLQKKKLNLKEKALSLKDKETFLRRMQASSSLRTVAEGFGLSFDTAQELWKEKNVILRNSPQVTKQSYKPFVARPAPKIKRLRSSKKNPFSMTTSPKTIQSNPVATTPMMTSDCNGNEIKISDSSLATNPGMEIDLVECTGCNRTFKRRGLKAHQRRMGCYNPEQCSTTVSQVEPLCNKTNYETAKDLVECSGCNRMFKMRGLKAHQTRMGCYKPEQSSTPVNQVEILPTIRRFECKLCERKFDTKVDLIRHIEIHTITEMCVLCGLSFFDADILDKHIKCQDGDILFSCDVCPKQS